MEPTIPKSRLTTCCSEKKETIIFKIHQLATYVFISLKLRQQSCKEWCKLGINKSRQGIMVEQVRIMDWSTSLLMQGIMLHCTFLQYIHKITFVPQRNTNIRFCRRHVLMYLMHFNICHMFGDICVFRDFEKN